MNDGQIPDQQEPDKFPATAPQDSEAQPSGTLMLSGLSTDGVQNHINLAFSGTGRPLRILVLILLLLSLLGFTGRIFWWADLLGYPRLHLLALISLTGTYYLLRRDWRMVVLCLIGALCNAFAFGLAIPEAKLPPAIAGSMPPGEIKVATLNVNVDNPNTMAVIDWIRAEQPDILMLVEANRQWLPLVDQLIGTLPYRRIADNSKNYGLILLSRFPLDNSATTRAGPYSLPTLSATAETPIGQITIIGAHPNLAFSADDYQANSLYMAQISAMAQTNTIPTLLIGDFSSVPWSLTFETIRRLPNLQPPVWKLPATWPANLGIFGLPLDQILLTIPTENPRALKVEDMIAGPQITGTTHRPVIARIKVN